MIPKSHGAIIPQFHVRSMTFIAKQKKKKNVQSLFMKQQLNFGRQHMEKGAVAVV